MNQQSRLMLAIAVVRDPIAIKFDNVVRRVMLLTKGTTFFMI